MAPASALSTGVRLGLCIRKGTYTYFDFAVGLSVANEVLIWGKKKTAQELLDCKFIKFVSFINANHCQPPRSSLSYSKIFPEQNPPSFHSAVRAHLLDELRGLDSTAILATKKLIRQGLNEKNSMDAVNLRESYGE